MPDDGPWSKGPVALLGDAVHAMLPFAAQGAGMAIEDAAVLAQAFEPRGRREHRGHHGCAETIRPAAPARACARVQRTARQQGRIYHFSGPLAFARDLAIRALGPQRMLARQDWIYGWRP